MAFERAVQNYIVVNTASSETNGKTSSERLSCQNAHSEVFVDHEHFQCFVPIERDRPPEGKTCQSGFR